jgi:uncharacterized protein (DUF1697 family)
MSMHVALLRGINVGGRATVTMSDLRKLFEDLGFAGAKSLLQSGNIVFDSDRHSGAALEQLLEAETAKRLKMSVDYLVRSTAEWKKIVARNPFPREAKVDPSHLVVMFMKTAPREKDVNALRAAIEGPESIRCDGKQLYVVYAAGIGRSKLTGTLIEQKLKSPGTARNWNTVVKLAAFCHAGLGQKKQRSVKR